MKHSKETAKKEAHASAPVAAPETAVFASVPPLQTVPVEEPSTQRQQHAAEGGPDGMTPLVLLVLDGWGIATPGDGNAISQAKTPHMDRLMERYPTAVLHASGEMVGLPNNEMGNSEVGHLNLGAGKIIYQHLPLINRSIADGSFEKNPVFLQAIQEAQERGSKLHLVGMVSDGGIHSSQEHLYALLRLCRDQGLDGDVNVHAILDGRDTAKNGALQYIAALETKMNEYGTGRVATLSGRYYAMDRDNRWDRIEAAYNAMRHGRSDHAMDSPLHALEDSYRRGVYDEEFEPTVITDHEGVPLGRIEDGDVVIFFNFRSDRARQLTKALALPAFAKFDRGEATPKTVVVTMTEYEKNLPVRIAFEPDHIEAPVGHIVSDAGLRQLRIAETEKYAHVTFFYNGGTEEQYPGEERALIPSPRVQNYATTPEMSVQPLAERIIQEVQAGSYDFVCANVANADMVGHTGDLQATIAAIEATDAAIGAIAEAVEAAGGTLVVTADHGNAEEMLDPRTGAVIKEHTTNPVPLIMCNWFLESMREKWPPVVQGDLSRVQPVGVLSDVAPTVLTLLGIDIPPGMTSRSVIR